MIEFNSSGEVVKNESESSARKTLLASDHAGFEMKEQLKSYLRELGHEVHDEGAFEFKDGDDYPDYVKLVAKQVSGDPAGKYGIVLGGSGQGEAMCANRFPNVRTTVYYGGTTEVLKISRIDNNANILSLGARFISLEEAKTAVKTWLETEFTGQDRHIRRIQKLDHDLEEENNF